MARKRKLGKQSAHTLNKSDDARREGRNTHATRKHLSQQISQPPTISTEKIQWTTRRMDHEFSDQWDWALTSKEAHQVLSFLESLTAKTWGEIGKETTGGRKPHRKHHSMPVSFICKKAQERLKERFANEELPEEIYRFRLDGKTRLWGIRARNIFEIIWFDRDHAVYPTRT